jgi:hypothetical protein
MTDLVERLRMRDQYEATLDHLGRLYGLKLSLEHEAATEIEWLRKERLKLMEDLGRAHAGVLPWIEQVAYLTGRWGTTMGWLLAASDALRQAGSIVAADQLTAKMKEEEEWMKQRLTPLSKQTGERRGLPDITQ